MTKAAPLTTITTVRDSKSGRLIAVKGMGALKGQMPISKEIDLTKPIFAQVGNDERPQEGTLFAGKRIANRNGASRSAAKH